MYARMHKLLDLRVEYDGCVEVHHGTKHSIDNLDLVNTEVVGAS
jgi:hypothetical protein